MRLTHTGHHILPDDSVLRLDTECGQHVASWYTPQSVLKAYACGSLAQMVLVIAAWCDAFEFSVASPSSGDRSGAVGAPAPGQTTLGGVA